MAVLSVCWLVAAGVFEVEQSAPLSDLWQGYGDPVAWLVLLWPALGQYSTGEAAQVAGQAKCAPVLCTHCSPVAAPDMECCILHWHDNLPQPATIVHE